MKKSLFILFSILLISFSIQANKSTYSNTSKNFIFVESGIEFAVFQDGQFDFNLLNNPQISAHIRTSNFSFNSGYNYDAFVQYDDYGAVIQIENTPIYYDHYGRVRRIGSTYLNYNNYGRVNQIGNLNIVYNNYGAYYACSGYVNNYSINYGFRPHHRYYRVPVTNRCIVYSTPYRINYVVNRCDYNVYRSRYHNNYYSTSYRYRNYRRPSVYINYNHYRNNSYNRNYRNNSYDPNRIVARSSSRTTSRKATPSRTYTPRSSSSSHSRSYTPRSSTSSSRNYSSSKTNTRSYTPRSISSKAITRSGTINSKTVANNRTSSNVYRRR